MVERITSFEPEFIAPLQCLLGQLTSRETTFGEQQLRELVQSDNAFLFVIREQQRIAGMLTLGTYLAPTGRKVWVEDVVVDSAYRGRGYGRELINHAQHFCEQHLAPCTLMLTSNPSRIAANALYATSSFEPKQTNVYKHDYL